MFYPGNFSDFHCIDNFVMGTEITTLTKFEPDRSFSGQMPLKNSLILKIKYASVGRVMHNVYRTAKIDYF